jgi:NifB/MoaA-like Fe-S oxidoreductase
MSDLASLWPQVASVSVVPVGLTCYREGLYPLEPFSSADCAAVIRRVEAFAKKCREKYHSLIFFCADEFYLKAGLPIHSARWYEGYPQLENGVGLIASMRGEFDNELRRIDKYDLSCHRLVSIATGEAAYDFICGLVSRLTERCINLQCNVYKIRNRFFGPEITVAGLICGCDIKEQLAEKQLGEKLLLPSVMLRAEGDVFLDDMCPSELEAAMNVKIIFVKNNDFIRKILSD